MCQRTEGQNNLLIALDEPFAVVTDDFIPFIVDRLNQMRKNQNVLLVTNDHVETLTSMADNTITVSAIDRSRVVINNHLTADRNVAIASLSVGDQYKYQNARLDDLQFFCNVEIKFNSGLLSIAAFGIFLFGLFTITFWNSAR